MASPLQMLKQRIMLDPLADSCLEYLNLGFKLQWVTQKIWFGWVNMINVWLLRF
jgi:hypothetical protein